MRLLHIADLHIGKSVCEFPMLEDQRHVLAQVVGMLAADGADALLVAGDLYDKSQPSADAVGLVDWFFAQVAATGKPAIVIPGNHDSAERVAYASGVLSAHGVHVAPVYDGRIEPVRLGDEHGPVDVWPIPFVRPATVRHFVEGSEASDYTCAMRELVATLDVDPTVRNVAVVHQFVTATGVGPDRTDSELSVGGIDNVDVDVFDAFEYVACGHVHRPQRIGRDTARYSGSILKYSASEVYDRKGAVRVTLGQKGAKPTVELVPLEPLHDMRRIEGPFDRLVSPEVAGDAAADRMDYVHAVLTDRDPVPDAMARLRDVYPNVMSLEYDNERTRAQGLDEACAAPDDTSDPLELFEEFFEAQNGVPMDDDQRDAVVAEFQRMQVM